MRILSCNMRGDNPEHDRDNQWRHRRTVACAYVHDTDADLICTQELTHPQFVDLAAAVPGHDSFGLADEILNRNPLNTIFWRRDRFERVAAAGYWLSRTPHIPGSKSWDSCCVRVANWVRLLDRDSGAEFRVINTHLDHVSQPARENQAALILEDAAAFPDDYPQVFTGDLNADRTNPAIAAVKAAGWTDTHEAIHGPGEAGCTFHHFLGPDSPAQNKPDGTGKIDWIFARGPWRVTDATILKEPRDGCYPSDHYFVLAEVMLAAGP